MDSTSEWMRLGAQVTLKERKKNDTNRKAILKTLLERRPDNKPWMELDTLSHVIGADRETTIRLLIEINARGNMLEQEVWALQSKARL